MTQQDFYEILDRFETCMFTTAAEDGTMRSRPMAIAQRDGDVLWFVTGRDSGKVDEVSADATVQIIAQSDRRWLSATGTTRTVDDDTTLDEIWSPVMNAWFPDGPTDSEVTALRVDLVDGEYWDVSGGKLASFAWGVASSLATGEAIDADNEGDYGRVDL